MTVNIEYKRIDLKKLKHKICISDNYLKKCILFYRDKEEYNKLINDCMKHCRFIVENNKITNEYLFKSSTGLFCDETACIKLDDVKNIVMRGINYLITEGYKNVQCYK